MSAARSTSQRSKPARGSYAERRLAQLKEERKKYNVNDLGYYNGGVPRANRGAIRGDALMQPGFFHAPQIHNYIHYQHPDSKKVDSEEAVQFKHFMGTDKADFLRSKPAHPMYYDTDFNYKKDRAFWLRVLVGLGVGSYGVRKWQVEKDRMQMTTRMGGFEGMPAHHFNNRGGVVVLKDFVGFEKYYQNGDALMSWYQKVYPKQMRGAE